MLTKPQPETIIFKNVESRQFREFTYHSSRQCQYQWSIAVGDDRGQTAKCAHSCFAE